jgi:hypothetical protein
MYLQVAVAVVLMCLVGFNLTSQRAASFPFGCLSPVFLEFREKKPVESTQRTTKQNYQTNFRNAIGRMNSSGEATAGPFQLVKAPFCTLNCWLRGPVIESVDTRTK